MKKSLTKSPLTKVSLKVLEKHHHIHIMILFHKNILIKINRRKFGFANFGISETKQLDQKQTFQCIFRTPQTSMM